MFGVLDNVGATVGGIFDTREDVINARIERFSERIEARETYLIQYEERLVRRFTALEELMSGKTLRAWRSRTPSAILTNASNEEPFAANTYMAASVETAPPLKVVRMLYEGALRFISRAQDAGVDGRRLCQGRTRRRDRQGAPLDLDPNRALGVTSS